MPTYDYLCQACEHAFEEFQSMTAKALRKCPKCGKLKLKRLIGTGAGVIFKGAGFWQTDYRSSSYKAGEKAASEAGKPVESKAESKTEGKSSDSAAKSKVDSPAKSDSAPTKSSESPKPAESPKSTAKKSK